MTNKAVAVGAWDADGEVRHVVSVCLVAIEIAPCQRLPEMRAVECICSSHAVSVDRVHAEQLRTYQRSGCAQTAGGPVDNHDDAGARMDRGEEKRVDAGHGFVRYPDRQVGKTITVEIAGGERAPEMITNFGSSG